MLSRSCHQIVRNLLTVIVVGGEDGDCGPDGQAPLHAGAGVRAVQGAVAAVPAEAALASDPPDLSDPRPCAVRAAPRGRPLGPGAQPHLRKNRLCCVRVYTVQQPHLLAPELELLVDFVSARHWRLHSTSADHPLDGVRRLQNTLGTFGLFSYAAVAVGLF